MTREQNIQVGLLITGLTGLAAWYTQAWLFGRIAGTAWLITLICPRLYTPVSFLWYRLATRLERFFSVWILAVLFFGVVTPVGWLRRRIGKDGWLLRRFGQGTTSVFKMRDHTYRPDDMDHQY